jgi:hypothetical protein
MNYSKEHLLESASGFAMPFEPVGEQPEVSLGYGEQKHPFTGAQFNHDGVDFVCPRLPLYALASGTVTGTGNDAVHDDYVIIRYGKYDVKYGHLSSSRVRYGQRVVAGEQVAVSGDFLHLGVSVEGKSIDPMAFLQMVYVNMETLRALGVQTASDAAFLSREMPVINGYEKDQDVILDMMSRYLPQYFQALMAGSYVPSERMQQGIRNIFAQSADSHYFYEEMPTIANPLGMTQRAAPLVSKVQGMLVSDFLAYMASQHQVYVPTWSEEQKKSLIASWRPMVSSSIH